MANIYQHRIEIFGGINDLPVPPNENVGCNGSYLIEKFNAAMDELGAYCNFTDAQIADLAVRILALENTVNGNNDGNQGGL